MVLSVINNQDEVSAISAKEVEVKFSKAVDEASVIASGDLKAGVFKLNNAEANTLTSGASLSKDGKTLTLVLHGMEHILYNYLLTKLNL